MNSDGSNQTRLTFNEASDSYPAWSPDGSQIVFNSTRVGIDGLPGQTLFVMDVNGDNVKQVMHLTFTAQPKWSPDGRWILFTGIINLKEVLNLGLQIYAIRPDGREQWRVSEPKPPTQMLVGGWSPDGKQVVYTENVDVKTSFQVIATLHPGWRKKVVKRERLPVPQMDFHSPAFSADGKSILLAGRKDGDGWRDLRRHIYRFRLDTHKLIQLTDNMWADLAPQEWNPRLSVPVQQGRLLLYWGAIKSNRLRH